MRNAALTANTKNLPETILLKVTLTLFTHNVHEITILCFVFFWFSFHTGKPHSRTYLLAYLVSIAFTLTFILLGLVS